MGCMNAALKAPFPYFGGKSRVAEIVWSVFGDVPNYVEPFFGSGAVLLGRPYPARMETVNDVDAYLANFWRAVQAEPDELARLMDWPVNEVDLEARHKWLVQSERKREHRERMRNDPAYYDVKIAAWWCWGLCQWIGRGWSAGEWQGPGDAKNRGNGVHRSIPHLGSRGQGVHKSEHDVGQWMRVLSARLRRVRVCCGDWSRVMGPSVTCNNGLTGVFLDPPYSGETGRCKEVYSSDDLNVADAVREWCLQNGKNSALRIALCGYQGEHDVLQSAGWRVVSWTANGGYGAARNVAGREEYANRYRERIWFSPACIGQCSLGLVDKT